jgi:hypothetical protein
MAALDLPLRFSEGVTLEEVSFAGTRSENFDFTAAKIDNERHTAVIGLLPMVFGENSDLAPGDGEIARLIFRVDDPELASLEISTTTIDDHEPMFVYTEEIEGAAHTRVAVPEFAGVIVALADGVQNESAELPISFALRQNSPNPFNPTTMIAYDLPAASQVRLEVFNILGQKVNTLVDEFQEAGSHSVVWNGVDNHGSAVASGVYFYRISAGANNAVKKMMMLK